MNRTFEATVVSTKMEKTIVVRIDRTYRHPRYRKVLNKHKTFKVHCEDKAVKPGDLVAIAETRPISKDKHFIFVKVLKSAVLPMVAEIKEESFPKKAQAKAGVKKETPVAEEVKKTPRKRSASKVVSPK